MSSMYQNVLHRGLRQFRVLYYSILCTFLLFYSYSHRWRRAQSGIRINTAKTTLCCDQLYFTSPERLISITIEIHFLVFGQRSCRRNLQLSTRKGSKFNKSWSSMISVCVSSFSFPIKLQPPPTLSVDIWACQCCLGTDWKTRGPVL